MEPKVVRFGPDAHRSVLHALRTAVRLVGPTLGPRPHTVLMEGQGTPRVAVSSLEILEPLEVKDRVESATLALIRDAAKKVRTEAGDGAATMLLLADAIVRRALLAIRVGADALAVARGIRAAEEQAQQALRKAVLPADSRARLQAAVRSTASLDGKVPDLIEQVLDDLTTGCAAIVEDSQQAETRISRVEGFQFGQGMASPHFINRPESGEVVLERPLVLLYEPTISSIQELAPFLERIVPTGRPLLLLVGGIDPEPIATLVVNRLQGILQSCAVLAPSSERHRETLMLDLGAATGGTAHLRATAASLQKITPDQLGSASRVLVDQATTTLTLDDPVADGLDAHLSRLRHSLDHEDLALPDRDELQDRIMRLSGRIVQIFVGAPTEPERVLLKSEIQSAVRAVRGAIKDGVVPGGGGALRDAGIGLRTDSADRAFRAGFEALRHALTAPISRILASTGIHPGLALERLGGGRIADAITGREGPADEIGVLDPHPVTSTALSAAASLAVTLLTTDAVVVEASRLEPRIPANIDQAWEARRRMMEPGL
jgi:chaperonin GroEL